MKNFMKLRKENVFSAIKFRQWILLPISILFIFGLAISFWILPAHSASYTVDVTYDAPDSVINGVCDDGTGSCTLRAAIQEANASVAVADNINFNIPNTDPGYNGQWYTLVITLGSNLPQITDDVVIDGFTQTANGGNTNPGVVGTGGTVGVDRLALPQYQKPEIEINVSDRSNCFDINAANTTIRGVAIYNTNGSTTSVIHVRVGVANFTIEENLIGVRADGSNPAADRNEVNNIAVNEGPTSGFIRNNYIGHSGRYGINLGRAVLQPDETLDVLVEGNEVFASGWNSNLGDNSTIYADEATIRGNLIRDPVAGSGSNPRIYGGGVEIRYAANNNLVENNTILRSITKGIIADTSSNTNTIRRNIIRDTHDGPAVVISEYGNVTGQGPEYYNQITENSAYDNSSLSIDLCNGCGSAVNGNGVTWNDGAYSSDPNNGIDFPVIISNIQNGNMLTLAGYVGNAPNLAVFANVDVEFFISTFNGTTDPNPTSGNDISPYHGEGRTYLGSLTTDASGNFSGNIDVSGSGLSGGDYLTATATDSVGNTSEFGENALSNENVADLALTKITNNNSPNEGDSVKYTITVTNNGPNTATDVQVTDVLPSGVAFISSSASQGNYNNASSVWNIGSINNAANATLDIAIAVNNNTRCETITNTAAITESSQSDPDPNNNSDNAGITVQCADLSIQKFDSPDPVQTEGELAYTITVANGGISDAINVSVTDTLPSGAEFVSASSGCSESDGIVSCNLGNLSVDHSSSINITVNAPSTPGAITNIAEVSSDIADPDTSNNADSENTDVQEAPVLETDLEIIKTDNADPVAIGEQLIYIITINNNGPENAANVMVVDNIPSEILSPEYSLDNGAAWSEWAGSLNIGNINASNSIQMRIRGTVGQSESEETIIHNEASVSSDLHDPNESNNTDSEDTAVEINYADLSLNKTAQINTVSLGGTIDYVIAITNSGPNDATGIEATDLLPAGLDYISNSPSRGTYDNSNGIWTVGDLPNGESAALNISTIVNAEYSGPSITNIAEITAMDQPDPGDANNRGEVAISLSSQELAETGKDEMLKIMAALGLILAGIFLMMYFGKSTHKANAAKRR